MTVRYFFGSMLMALGGLITIISGPCTLVALAIYSFAAIKNLAHGDTGGLFVIGLPLVVGGIPFLIGMGLTYAGRVISGEQDESKKADKNGWEIQQKDGQAVTFKKRTDDAPSSKADALKKVSDSFRETWNTLIRTDFFLVEEMRRRKVHAYTLIFIGGLVDRVAGAVGIMVIIYTMAYDLRYEGANAIAANWKFFLFYCAIPWLIGRKISDWGMKLQGPPMEGQTKEGTKAGAFYGTLFMFLGGLLALAYVWRTIRSTAFSLNAWARLSTPGEIASYIILPIISSAIPFLAGVGLFLFGRWLLGKRSINKTDAKIESENNK